MPITRETYLRVAMEEHDRMWEVVHGCLSSKEATMTMHHNWLARLLGRTILRQVTDDYDVVVDQARLEHPGGDTYIPDVCVVPISLVRHQRGSTDVESYAGPVPFVAEVRSPSTGRRDLATKLAGYQERGDAEIWLIDRDGREVRAWVREMDGSYTEREHREAETVELTALPGVRVDLADLWREP